MSWERISMVPIAVARTRSVWGLISTKTSIDLGVGAGLHHRLAGLLLDGRDVLGRWD